MEWGKTKNILILVLVIVNIFLYINMQRITDQKLSLPEQYVADALAKLRKDGITVKNEAIPTRRLGLPIAEISSRETLYSIARNALMDKNLIPIISGEGVTFSNENGIFILKSETDFLFIPESNRPDFKQILEASGFRKSNYVVDESGTIRFVIGGVDVEGCEVVWRDGEYSGTIFSVYDAKRTFVDLIDPVNALLKFTEYAKANDLGQQAITGFTSVYLIGKEGFFTMVTAYPTYKITSNSEIFLVDAVTGEITAGGL